MTLTLVRHKGVLKPFGRLLAMRLLLAKPPSNWLDRYFVELEKEGWVFYTTMIVLGVYILWGLCFVCDPGLKQLGHMGQF